MRASIAKGRGGQWGRGCRSAWLLVAAWAALWAPGLVFAQAISLPVAEIAPGRLHFDGRLDDWRGIRFAALGDDSDDASMRYALGYDQAGLYLGAEVVDDVFVRSPRPGMREDAIVLTLVMPGRGRRPGAVELWLYAGIPGRQPASVAMAHFGGRPRSLRGVRAVEAPRRDGHGYTLEVWIPWRKIPGAERWQRARAAIRLQDVDMRHLRRVETVLRSARVERGAFDRLPPLRPSGGTHAQLAGFLAGIGQTTALPRFDLDGNVHGDRRPERVVVIERYVVVLGPGYKDGQSYDYLKLPVTLDTDVQAATLRDLTGDRVKELAVQFRQRTRFGSRRLWRVISFAGPAPRALFTLELGRRSEAGFVQAQLEVRRTSRRQPPLVRVRVGRSGGPDVTRLPLAGPDKDTAPLLVPWGPVVQRDYQWDGDRFVVQREVPNPTAPVAEPAPTAPSAPRAPMAPSPLAGTPSAFAPSVLLALFRREQGVGPEVRPRFLLQANLAEGREPEQLQLLGTALVIVGPQFRGGRSYLYYRVPARTPGDVLDLRTADVTGDGRREVFVRVRQQLGAAEREVWFGYQLGAKRLQRIAALAVRLKQGANRIENRLRFVRQGRGSAIEVQPGKAVGWSEATYPYLEGGSDGVAPLLLPWRDRSARYVFDGERMIRTRMVRKGMVRK